jgi:hypothetical protein
MGKTEKTPIIDLPVKITLSSEGVEWHVRNKKPLKRLRMADNSEEFGMALATFSARSLQKMIDIDYVTGVEIARTQFSDKRGEIIDLSKLIVYHVLYRSFARESYALFLKSPLISAYNRAHPTRIIDESSIFNPGQVESLKKSCAPELPLVSEDIQKGLLAEIRGDGRLAADEKQILTFLSDKYVVSMRDIMWCFLARSRGEPEYNVLVGRVCALLRRYLDKSRIAEYLSLMVTELLTYVESLQIREVGRRLFGKGGGTVDVLHNPARREAVLKHMRDENDYLYLTYHVSSRGPSLGTENRLRIVIFNSAREYEKVKTQIEKKGGITVGEKGLADFYRKTPPAEMDTELGLYYLSYLQAECAKCDVRMDSRVSEIPAKDLTVINLSLQF